jgi:hypothetical protein
MRAMMWIACMSLLTACRFGFDEQSTEDGDNDDDDVIVTPPMPGSARVLVLGEDGRGDAGEPVADAYVVVVEQSGATTTTRTGDDGIANVEILGNTAIHVARPLGADEWALSSFRAVNDGAYIIAGGQPSLSLSDEKSVTVNLPAFPIGYDQAWITGPRKCLLDSSSALVPQVPVTYDPRCEGQTIELFALAYDIYVPLGSVTLTDGDTIDRSSAAWTQLDKVGIDYENVPSDVNTTYAFIAWPTSTNDRIPMSESGEVPDANRFVGLHFDLPPIVPGTSMIHVFESFTGARAVFERIDSWPGTRVFDASMIPPAPPVPSVDVAGAQVQWSPGGAAPDADLYWTSTKITIGTTYVHWNAFGPPGATQVTFPALPAELSAIIPPPTAAWTTPRVVLAGLSDFDYQGAIEIVDRDMFWWWSEGVYLPPGTVSMTATQIP